MKKRSMVLFLALVMAVGLCVTTAWADGVGYFDPTASGSGQNKICETYTLVTGSAGTDPVSWTGGTSKDAPAWCVVNENVTISGTVNITDHVCLILCDGKTLTVNGITVDDGGSLTINGQSGQSGKLLATGACVEGTNSYSYSYGISGGTLTFNGGVIEATGGTANSSYGIVASKTITINAGTVTATGGEANAESYGICAAMDLIINGGTVIATGGKADGDQYAISSGITSYESITINNGAVTAIGGEANGAMYGSSYGIWICNNEDITVKNGSVIATGGKATSGIAGRAESCGICAGQYDKEDDRYSGSLNIEGGTVIGTGGEAIVIEAAVDPAAVNVARANDAVDDDADDNWTIDNGAYSYGICGYRRLTIKNGTVIAETTADGDIVEKAAVFYGEAYSMPDAYGTAWWWRTVKDGAYQGHPSFIVSDFESDYLELITTDPYPHQHTRRQPTATTSAPADSDKGTEDKSDVVTSAKTFDAGVAVYAVLGVLSLTGSAWVARKKW